MRVITVWDVLSLKTILLYCSTLLFLTAGPVSLAWAQDKEMKKGSSHLADLSADETSVDIHKLRQAKSLLEIYELANGMHVGSVNDQRMLSKAVDEYMKKCCSSQDRALQEIKKAKFNKIQDITGPALKRPAEHFMAETEFNRAIFSEYRAHIRFFDGPSGLFSTKFISTLMTTKS